jgi:ribose-phosphate pyrophosphokinase
VNYELVSIDPHFSLAQEVAAKLEKKLILPEIIRFADGEIEIKLPTDVDFDRKMVVLLQSTYRPVSDSIMQFAFTLHALKNAGAAACFCVIPYFAYSRHEESPQFEQKPGEAAVVAALLMAGGLDALVSVDLHTDKIADFFFGPVASLTMAGEILEHIKKQAASVGKSVTELCLVAPDKGAEKRVQAIAQKLGGSYLAFTKERYAPNKTRIVGSNSQECTGTHAIIIDDIFDTGSMALSAADELKKRGFSHIWGYFVHPVFSGDAQEKVEQSVFEKVYVYDTISVQLKSAKIEQLSAAQALSECIPQLPALITCGSESAGCSGSCSDCSCKLFMQIV